MRRRVAGPEHEDDFEDTYVELFVRAERTAYRILGNRAEAEDVAAETLTRALAAWNRVRAYSLPWVTRVASNLAIDIVRRKPLPDLVAAPDGTDGTDAIALVTALRTLPERQRQALALQYLVGLDGPATAEVMGVSTNTVKTHTHRGLAALRLQFDDREELTGAH